MLITGYEVFYCFSNVAIKCKCLLTLTRRQCVPSKCCFVIALNAASYTTRIKPPLLLYEAGDMAGWVKETAVLSESATSD